MESSEKSKLLDGKGVNIEVKREHSTTTVKVKASSTVKDAKPSTTYHKERLKIGRSSSSSSTSSSSTTRSVTITRVCPVKEEVQTASSASCSSSSVLSSSSGSCATSAAASSTADRSFTAADSNSNKSPASSCRVCGDKASGYHYGVTSCEGCKGFFRRSIQKQIEYRCLRDSHCQVIRLNRNRCQYCRFKKCLSVGMSRDSVRYGRVPKRSKGRDDESRVTQSEADQSATKEGELTQAVICDITIAVSQAHHANCPYTEEKTRGLIRKPAQFSDVEVSEDTVDSLEQQKLTMWEHFAEYVTPSVQRIVEFAKKTPGFSELVQDDQLILIKSGFFEMWMVQVSRMIEPNENTLTFCDGSYVSRNQLELIFDQDFISFLFSFGETFNNLRLGETELALFSAMVLLTSDRPGITDTKFIKLHQDKIYEALKCHLNSSRPGEVHMLSTVLSKLPELRTLGVKHNEHLKWFRMHWERVKLPPLFAEIFDIPKCEDEKL